MGVVLMAFGWLRGPFMGFLRGIPPAVWYAIAAALALLAIWHWHTGKVDAARLSGRHEQAAADTVAYTAAQSAATALQARLVAATAAKATLITERTAHDLADTTDAIARRAADIRLRHAQAYPDPGSTSAGTAVGISGGAGITDIASCAAQGWVAFPIAADAAEAADRATAVTDAWQEWYAAQLAAWPASEPVATPRPNEVTP